MERFYGLELVERLDILMSLASIEAWRARDHERDVTLVRSRPDIIASQLEGKLYFSNVDKLDADLLAIASGEQPRYELELLEIRRVENGKIPLGVFEAYQGWPLRDVISRVTCEPAVAAVVALEVFLSYTTDDALTTVTADGALIRQVLPPFDNVHASEVPSFTGLEPEVSVRARIREGRAILETMSSLVTNSDRDKESEEAGAAFVAELERIADHAAAGPTLARLVATVH